MDVRPTRDDADLARLVEVRNVVVPDDRLAVEDVIAFSRSAQEYAAFLAWEGEQPVGGASAAIEPRSPIAWVSVSVLPAERGRGVGSALFEAISRWGGERGHREAEGMIAEGDAAALAFAAHRGFSVRGREEALELELAALEPPPVAAPDGVELTTLAVRPELARGVYEVAREATPDIPGEEDSDFAPFEEWARHDLGGPGDRADATFLAIAGDEVVGYAKFSLTSAQPTVAHHDLTAVKRAWRGRGIARALKAAQIRWAKEHGYERLATKNEERNAPIKRLNEHFGYRAARAWIFVRGPLARDPRRLSGDS